uniref:Uncharacterized protein n=1 Tax=Setaria digitata TaxID=48799 RepID=A0A915PZX5_9BILA
MFQRVGDDISLNVKPTSTSQTISSNKQVGATDNLREAVSMGLELMRTRFKRIDLRPEDLDEEDDPTCLPEPIFEPYDENLSRPLPLLIGSSDWLSSSFATSSDKRTEATKVTEEVVVSLPPFAQPRIAEYTTSSHSDSINERPVNVILSRKTSGTFGSEDFVVKVDNCSNKCDTKSYASQVQFDFSLFTDFPLIEELCVIDIHLPLYVCVVTSEVPVIHRDSAVSVEHPDYESIPKPSDLEASARYFESGISFKRNLTGAVEDESKVKGSSNALGKLFVDSSSDEDDLFSDLKNTGKKAKRHIPTYSNDSQIVSFPESKTDLQTTSTDVHSSALLTNVLRRKSPLIATDDVNDVNLNGTENAETTDTFRNKLDSILSNKIITNTTSSVEERQVEESAGGNRMNGETSATLSSLAKLRAKGPPRRSPSRLLQQSNKKDNKNEVKSVPSSVMSQNTEDGRIIEEQTDTCEGRRDLQLRIDSRQHISENVNNMKQRNDISSIFSSDSDDDIFSTFSSKPKRGESVSKPNIPRVGKEEARPPLSVRERSLITSSNRAQTFKTSSELRNLFDSDDEDLFTSSIPTVKRQNQAARDIKSGNGEVIQEVITPKRNGPVGEKREAVAPTEKQSNSKSKRIDIFSDDSDGDLFK